jgi:hypothetical protein
VEKKYPNKPSKAYLGTFLVSSFIIIPTISLFMINYFSLGESLKRKIINHNGKCLK